MMKRALPAFLLAIAVVGAAPLAHANSDEVQFGSDINVTGGHPAHDAVCFFCSVRADGEVNGDIVVFFGDVDLNGEAHHDVVNFFGKITAADNSTDWRRHGELLRFGPPGRERHRRQGSGCLLWHPGCARLSQRRW